MPYYRETCFQRPEKCLYFEIIDYRYCTVTTYIYWELLYSIHTIQYVDFPLLFLDFRYYFQTSQTFRYYFQTSVTIPRLPRLSVTISRLPLLFRDFLSLFLVSLSYFVAPPITVPIFSAIVLDFLTVFLDFPPLPQSSCHFF